MRFGLFLLALLAAAPVCADADDAITLTRVRRVAIATADVRVAFAEIRKETLPQSLAK